MAELEFTNNYTDLSTDQGFQFEFTCNRCRNGYRTEFDSYELATASTSSTAPAASSGASSARAPRRPTRSSPPRGRSPADKAFRKAVEEIRPKFIQCPRCSAWVCREQCWNEKKGLCKDCAPDMGVEMAAAQAGKSVEEIWAHAHMAEEDKHLAAEDWRAGVVASCPNCGAPQEVNAKFCAQCGQDLKTGQALHAVRRQAPARRQVLRSCGAKVGG